MKKTVLSEKNKDEVLRKVEKFLSKENKQYSFLAVDYTSNDNSLPAIEQALIERNKVLESTFEKCSLEILDGSETVTLASFAIDTPLTGDTVANDLQWGDSIYIGRDRLIVYGKPHESLVNAGEEIDKIIQDIPGTQLGKLFQITLN
jgi:hypothetical protein